MKQEYGHKRFYSVSSGILQLYHILKSIYIPTVVYMSACFSNSRQVLSDFEIFP